MIALKKSGMNGRWWYQYCSNCFETLEDMDHFPLKSLFAASIPVQKIIGCEFVDSTQSEDELVMSILQDIIDGINYDRMNSSGDNECCGGIEFLFLRESEDRYSFCYLSDASFESDVDSEYLFNCVMSDVARSILLRSIGYFHNSNMKLSPTHFVQVSRVDTSNFSLKVAA